MNMLIAFILAIISSMLIDNVVLSRFYGICPFLGVSRKVKSSLGMGLGYMIALISMAFFREFLGTGGFSIGKVFTFIPQGTLQIIPKGYEISLFQTPVGAFIVFGVILAVLAFIKNRKAELKANLERQALIKKKQEAAAAAAAAAAAKQAEGGNK